jgi:segregation and condensation protein B
MDKIPELKEILGAMVFAAKRPLSVREMRRCLQEVAEAHGEETAVFGEAKNADIRDALAELTTGFETSGCGFAIQEVAGGYRLQSDPKCGTWLRHMLAIDKPQRLSRPALETLAIIAYRQPIPRSEIEGVRGVAVGHMVRALMEMQLVKIVGRSDLPGRPLLYGTTHAFLEHFGLKDLKELSQIEPSLLVQRETKSKKKTKEEPVTAEEEEAANELPLEDAPEDRAEDTVTEPRESESPTPPATEEDVSDEDQDEDEYDDEDEDDENG